MTANDKIIAQIRQLLKISSDGGASINERELAQRRAERLMVRYRIEIATREETTSTGQELVLASRYKRAEAKAREGRKIRMARDLMIDHDATVGGQRDGYASGIGWMGERLDGPRVGIAAS